MKKFIIIFFVQIIIIVSCLLVAFIKDIEKSKQYEKNNHDAYYRIVEGNIVTTIIIDKNIHNCNEKIKGYRQIKKYNGIIYKIIQFKCDNKFI